MNTTDRSQDFATVIRKLETTEEIVALARLLRLKVDTTTETTPTQKRKYTRRTETRPRRAYATKTRVMELLKFGATHPTKSTREYIESLQTIVNKGNKLSAGQLSKLVEITSKWRMGQK